MTTNAPAQVGKPAKQPKVRKEKQHKSRKDMTKFEYFCIEAKRTWVGYLFVFPFVVLFTAFTVVPVILSILLSFTNFNMLEVPDIVFLDNYVRMLLEDDLFMTAFTNTMMFAVATGPLNYIISFVIAWFINELPPKIRAFVTFIFYAPSISGNSALIWTLLFQGDIYGLVNGWLMKFGLISDPIIFFQNPDFIVPICIVVSVWTSLGMGFLSNIAGLQGVDRSLYEAGAIDGIKNRWQELWYITLPSMKTILMFGAVLAITGAFGFGGIVSSLCGATAGDYVGWCLSHHLGEYMTTRFEFGYASAIAVVLFFIMITANWLVQKLLSKVGT